MKHSSGIHTQIFLKKDSLYLKFLEKEKVMPQGTSFISIFISLMNGLTGAWSTKKVYEDLIINNKILVLVTLHAFCSLFNHVFSNTTITCIHGHYSTALSAF